MPAHIRAQVGMTSSTRRKRGAGELSSSQDENPKRSKPAPSNLLSAAPLAEQLRPIELEDYVGQKHLIGPGSLLGNMLKNGSTGNAIFWGPPG